MVSSAAYTEEARTVKADRLRDKSAGAREIGEIPEPVDPARRESARVCLRTFCETYMPETFYLGWSPDHLEAIRLMQTAILEGGQFALAMPRGSGKTSLCEAATTWAIVYGHRRFIVIVGSEATLAQTIVDNISVAIETSETLAEDFPEAAIPVQALEGIAQRAKGQVCQGERTHISWGADKLIFPTTADAKCSGAIVVAKGLTGSIRGLKERTCEGDQIRPDLVLLDDPQTDQSARTPSQVEKRKRLITQAILGLAGPGKKISALMPCTVIQEGDLADQMLDRNLHPEWQGRRTSMMHTMPDETAMKLWEEYDELKKESLKQEKGITLATEFYRKHRSKMDKGAEASWDDRHNHDEISAIQHGMNLYLADNVAFFSEYQNQPIKEDDGGSLKPAEICKRLNRHPRRVVPAWCQQVTAYIDVQMHCMFFVVCGWGEGMQGAVLDYGSYPEQKESYWSYKSIKRKLKDVAGTDDLLGYLYHGLEETTAAILGKHYKTDTGHEMAVSRCLVDASWGDSTDTVYQFCRQSPWSNILTPSHGRGITASSKPLNEYATKPGEKAGHYWRMPVSQKGRGKVRHIIYDTNYWKTWTKTALLASMGGAGSVSLFGNNEQTHALFADQLVSEYSIKTIGRGRELFEWSARPDKRDNHWWDCLVGTAVAASMCGMMPKEWRRSGDSVPKRQQRRKIKYGAISKM